jgi:hypothetical protein
MKRVYVAANPAEAHLVRGLLEAEGIAAEVHGEDLFGARGAVPATPETAPTVWVVEDADGDRGLEIAQNYERANAAPPSDAAPWTCPACGEENEAGFGACWKCGAESPA